MSCYMRFITFRRTILRYGRLMTSLMLLRPTQTVVHLGEIFAASNSLRTWATLEKELPYSSWSPCKVKRNEVGPMRIL